MAPALIKSKQRVADHGEVLTAEREVNAMLDLVRHETERIESRFLEPACGTGNFLVEILRRKLDVVDARYVRSQLEWERNAVLALSSMYGIELLEDNVTACRERLYAHWNDRYAAHFGERTKDRLGEVARFVIARNILWGDALTLTTVGPDPVSIVFSEWSPVNGSLIKRRDFEYQALMLGSSDENRSLFAPLVGGLQSDTGEAAFIPHPVREFPLTHFLELDRAHPQ